MEVHNQVGFYVSCQLGLAFSIQNLRLLIKAYKNFRNSVMVIYDINKSTYGLNPFQCFRLSEEATAALKINKNVAFDDMLIQ
jgi:hypothetical protein